MRRRRGISTKTLVALLSLVLLLGCSLGGTLAWLSDSTDPVINTFTVGDVNIELDETTGTEYKIVPGVNIAKDPKVTVKANSEACWLFVKIEESANWPDELTYTIATGWTKLTGVTGVYYREVDAETAKNGDDWQVLAGDNTYPDGVVTVSDTLTKSELQELASNNPTLTFTAYAVQQEGVGTAEEAWNIAQGAGTT